MLGIKCAPPQNSVKSLPPLFFLLIATFALPASGVVNHLSGCKQDEQAPRQHPERDLSGLNQAIRAEFSGVKEFPYWDHVGMVGLGSGIYLGDGCVLTSAHVGCFPFRMHDGSAYEPDYKTWRVLRNEGGTKSDLAVFRVRYAKSTSLARLGVLPFGNDRRGGGSPVVLLGTGYTQSALPLMLFSQGSALTVLGYRVQPQRSVVWGINREVRELDSPVRTLLKFSTRCFSTHFERTPFAGQATDGDSGGAAFVYNRDGGRWELAGCIIAVSQERDSVAFGNRTYLGDLNLYAAQVPTSATFSTTAQAALPSVTGDRDPIEARPASVEFHK